MYVYNAPVIQAGLTLKGIAAAFTSPHAGNWHPLTTLSHMLDCGLYGLNAGGHHATNVVLHTIAALLLFHVLRQMTGALWKSAIVAALFAVHPLHVESIAWVSERKDVLSAVFFFLMLDAYGRYARATSITRYLVVTALFVAGLMSKPMLVTAPIVFLVLDYWPLRRFEQIASTIGKAKILRPDDQRRIIQRLFVEKIPWLILSAGAGIVTFVLQKRAAGSIPPLPFLWRARMRSRVTSFTPGKHCGRRASPFFILIQMILWQLGRLFSRLHFSSPSLVRQSFGEISDLICLPVGSGTLLCWFQ